jgi:hypothetical protein
MNFKDTICLFIFQKYIYISMFPKYPKKIYQIYIIFFHCSCNQTFKDSMFCQHGYIHMNMGFYTLLIFCHLLIVCLVYLQILYLNKVKFLSHNVTAILQPIVSVTLFTGWYVVPEDIRWIFSINWE